MWSDPPDFEQVQITHLELGKKRAELRMLQSKVKLETLDIKKNNPRKPWLIEEATQAQQEKIAALESEISILEAQKDFFNYWKDLFRSLGYTR